MSDPNRALSEVPSLIEERRKYQAWIAALEARRESTPAHVFQRVHDDYRDRLRRVEDQLAAYRGAIDTERTNAETRLAQIRQEEQSRTDERAELELRIQVGELSGAEATTKVRALEETLGQFARERERLGAQIAEFGKVFGAPTGAEPAPPGVTERRTTVAGGAFDELAFLSSVVEFDRPAASQAAQPAPAPPAAPPPAQPAARPPAEAAPPPRMADIQDRDLEALAPRDEGGASLLTGVTGAAPTATHDSTASESMLRDLGSANASSRSETPAVGGKRAPGTAPLTSRQTATSDQPKTLKCTECGAMNYPTEWYCERCGAELAAL
jgi:hypothetical protein